MDYILNFKDLNISLNSLVGSKNANMGEMINAGIRVPPGFAVTTDAYLNFITKTGIKPKITDILLRLNTRDIHSIDNISIELQKLIMNTPIPNEIRESIESGYQRFCREFNTDSIPVAVRSSATAEDLPTASFAGQHETYLWIKSQDRVVEKVRECWASLFTPRAIDYRIKNHILLHEEVLMSVSVQKMVNSKAAGVMFTINPTNGDLSKVIIEGSWGLGEAVVLGSVNPDIFIMDKVMKEILKSTISIKDIEYIYDSDIGEVVKIDLPIKMRNKCCLKEDEIFTLFNTAKTIETHYDRPMDIEWAIDQDFIFPDNIFIVQARPETVWSQRETNPIIGRKTFLQIIFEKIEQSRLMKGIKIPRVYLQA